MNNSFEQCIANLCGKELSSLVCGGKYAVFSDAAVVEGHKGILEYSESTVCFAFGKGKLTFWGSGLKIKCLEKHFATLSGKVSAVKYE